MPVNETNNHQKTNNNSSKPQRTANGRTMVKTLSTLSAESHRIPTILLAGHFRAAVARLVTGDHTIVTPGLDCDARRHVTSVGIEYITYAHAIMNYR